MLAASTRRRLLCFLLVFIVSLGACSTANVGKNVAVGTATLSPTDFMPQAKPFPNAAQLNAYLTHLTETGVLSGSVLVAKQGMLFTKGYGLADKDAHVPNTP